MILVSRFAPGLVLLGTLGLTLAGCGGGRAAEPQAASPTRSSSTPEPTPPAPVPPLATPAPAAPGLSADAIHTLLAASDRTDEDKKLDTKRHPDQFLAFLGIGPGMRVADLGSGGGYTTELLARAVGPTGKVYAQNDPDLVKRFMDKAVTARLARPVNAGVERADRPFDDPLPAEATDLDLVVLYIFYHDVVWIGADRDKMNRAILAALKPGGAYVIVDASAKAGDGVTVAKTLHRIEESTVRAEVQRAGFTLAGSGDFLRNPSDARDWNSSPKAAGERRGTEDCFVLKFRKP
jgi:predicted methyltransferase